MLFCPFCGEGFEARRECPEHELRLVPIDALQRGHGRGLDRVDFFVDPRLGRGAVLAGAFCLIVAFAAPFVRSGSLSASALEVAIDGAHNLWLTVGVGVLVLAILWRRRDSASMRGARLAVLGLAIGGGFPLIYTARRIELVAGAALVEWRWGAYVLVAALVAMAAGSLFLGGKPERRTD